MLRPFQIPFLRIAACCGLCILVVAQAQSAGAQIAPEQSAADSRVAQLQLRMDGVSGAGTVASPLGPDAFPVASFTVPVGRDEKNIARPAGSGPPTPEDISFNMGVTSPAVQLWLLAVDGKVVPKASLAAFDPKTGKIRYRIDLEQVVVKSFGLQTLGISRETIVGTLAYEKIRFTSGTGKEGSSASWERARAAKE